MAEKAQKKVLVAVDGTERSIKTVRYLTQVEPFKAMNVVLFNVFSSVPAYYYDLEKEPASFKVAGEMRAWESQQKKTINEHMHKCRQILVQSGFGQDAVEMRIHKRRKGVARDIIKEAQKGYHAVVLRRRGMAQLRGMVMGSVATKLLEKLSFIPLLIAGQNPVNTKYLLAVDGSPNALKAVDFTAASLAGQDCAFGLIHAVRNEGEAGGQMGEASARWAKAEVPEMFGAAIERLAAHGFDRRKITTKLTTGVYSRAGAIVEEAGRGGYGTIVVGRRGLSRVKEFFIGRVSNKVVQVGRKFTVWVVP
jgi:nucleotide-binding universal stress UspA family protein